MRQIKFRGRMLDGGRWIYGSLLTWPDGETYILYDRDFATTGTMSKDPVRPETVGQYTGMKDRSGTEIYEGDIVNFDDEQENGVVVYDNEQALFGLKYDDRFNPRIFGLYDSEPHELEVIGNIHDK